MLPAPRLMLLMLAGLALAAVPSVIDASLWPVPVALWAALLVFGLADAWVLAHARPAIAVDVPETAGVGADLWARVALQLNTPRALRAALRPEVSSPLLPAEDVHALAAHGRTEHALALRVPRRGGGSLDAIWLRLDGPFRLMRRIERHATAAPVAVVPNAERVRELLLEHFGAQRFGGIHVERRIGDGGEFDALESYQPGMDLRSVDWKASARHQALRVRRFRVEQNQRVIVCVDTGRLMAEPIEGLERLDHAIHASLLLGQVALEAGDLVGAHAYGDSISAWVPPAGGMRQMTRLRRGLADLSSAPEETNHVLGIRRLLARLRRRSLVVVFTEFTDATTAELMVEHIGHLARRHLVVFVALDDPGLDAFVDAPPNSAEALAASVVASGLRQDRARVLRRLGRMGVDVIHAPPGPAALALLARYVRVKRRGLIG